MHHDITVHRVVKSSKRAGQYIEPHIHAFFHFIYGLDGHLQVQVGAKRIQTKPGILVMVPPGVEHSVVSLDTSISLDIKFSCSSETAQIMAGLPTAAGPLNDQAGCLLRCILDEAIAQSFGHGWHGGGAGPPHRTVRCKACGHGIHHGCAVSHVRSEG